MKKIITALLTALLFISCSNINTKTNEINTEKKYETLLNDWKLDELDLLLNSFENSDENRIIEKYKILLQERREDKSALEEMIKKLKNQLESNNFENIELFFNDSFVNRQILSQLKNVDFSKMRIVYTEPEFFKNSAKNIAAVIYTDNVEYFQFSYRLSNKRWSIIEIKDGR